MLPVNEAVTAGTMTYETRTGIWDGRWDGGRYSRGLKRKGRPVEQESGHQHTVVMVRYHEQIRGFFIVFRFSLEREKRE